MSRNLFDLTGRVVLAAGANSGIGLGFLMGCAKQGADVVVWGRRADKNAQAVETLKAAGVAEADIVRLCELNAFMSYQARVLAGLAILKGASA